MSRKSKSQIYKMESGDLTFIQIDSSFTLRELQNEGILAYFFCRFGNQNFQLVDEFIYDFMQTSYSGLQCRRGKLGWGTHWIYYTPSSGWHPHTYIFNTRFYPFQLKRWTNSPTDKQTNRQT